MKRWWMWYIRRRNGQEFWYPARPQYLTTLDAFNLEFQVKRSELGADMYRWYWDGRTWQYDARPSTEFLASN